MVSDKSESCSLFCYLKRHKVQYNRICLRWITEEVETYNKKIRKLCWLGKGQTWWYNLGVGGEEMCDDNKL